MRASLPCLPPSPRSSVQHQPDPRPPPADATLESLIRDSPRLRSLIDDLAAAPLPPAPSSSASDEHGSDDDDDVDGGEREIVELARTAAELMDEPARD